MTPPDKDSVGGGSGDGGTLGTPSGLPEEEPPGEDDGMVVSGGGVAETDDEDGATASGDSGLG